MTDDWGWIDGMKPSPRTPWCQWPKAWAATYRWYETAEALCMAVVDERRASIADRVAAATKAGEIRKMLRAWKP